MTPRCVCGEEATGLVVEGHLHPYCAWQAERARADALREFIDDNRTAIFVGLRYVDGPGAERALEAALAADREGRSS